SRKHIASNSDAPCCKRFPLPLETAQSCERALKHLRGQVLCLLTTCSSARDECVHTIEGNLVKLGKTRRIGLRRFDQGLFIAFGGDGLQQLLREFAFNYRMRQRARKVTRAV